MQKQIDLNTLISKVNLETKDYISEKKSKKQYSAIQLNPSLIKDVKKLSKINEKIRAVEKNKKTIAEYQESIANLSTLRGKINGENTLFLVVKSRLRHMVLYVLGQSTIILSFLISIFTKQFFDITFFSLLFTGMLIYILSVKLSFDFVINKIPELIEKDKEVSMPLERWFEEKNNLVQKIKSETKLKEDLLNGKISDLLDKKLNDKNLNPYELCEEIDSIINN